MTVITEPGVYDIPEADYFADPVPDGSLSSSGARKLLPPSCPAIFHHEQQNPPPSTRVLDVGSAAHKLILGAGPDIVVVDAVDWRTKAAQAKQKEAYAAGKIPLLAAEHEQVVAMADALHQHPIASVLLDPDRGVPEQSLFWQDPQTGVWRRSRFDWLPKEWTSHRLIVTDYKTARSANPDRFARSAADFGYHCQAAWYLDAVHDLGLADDAAFLFIVQEKTPPYLVTVVELDALALRIGRDANRRAIDTYIECRATGRWPGYSDDIELVSLPAWVENRYLQETA